MKINTENKNSNMMEKEVISFIHALVGFKCLRRRIEFRENPSQNQLDFEMGSISVYHLF
jgi:hypothetical protein